MNTRLDPVLSRIDADLDPALERLMTFLRIPSISTDPAHKADCRTAAEWLVADLKSLGAEAELCDTPGHPMVWGKIGSGSPHLLFYGHYDVQPVDPLSLWDHDPFAPFIEERETGKVIRGRGASDDKGQLMTFVEACRAWIAEHGTLPCTITFFFEGEEESGSPSLIPFMEANKDKLAADLALICDTSMVSPGVPSIASQLRGMLKDEFTLIGPSMDLHSGHYGGPALNPLREISKIIASFHDDQGRVTVKDFYDGVEEVSAEQLAQWENCGFDEKDYLGNAGMTVAHGEAGYSTLEQQWARPTLEINGLWGGYQGPGSKTVIPSEAHCKITCRLVGQQDPDKIRENLHAHVEARLPVDAKVVWDQDLEGSPAAVMNTARPEFEAARQALSDEWNREAVFAGMGGSIPIAGFFTTILGLDSMLVGYADDDDRIHSPNEKYGLKNFHKGIRSWARILDAVSKA
ncbi:dipeptidase [Celeribacter persicus]|uniref:Acetylornithine deacetylase/succinyl-diaminopimelate desuccinylase-like protein n=1 Tax=Celeribacter persicus TaxID=1651082 RepID=A0A2T5HUZ2_9RHOB|nr:dipeptidase [Celeribacter persicus]PTQ75402.1 acetylornithine deacetylase/succinyl-diaminopimelate desuccinylase-like protein [Celeribacter persicus]